MLSAAPFARLLYVSFGAGEILTRGLCPGLAADERLLSLAQAVSVAVTRRG